MALALPFSPIAEMLLVTFGLALIYVELNRPGLVLPGASGLLALLLAFASLAQLPHPALPLLLLLLALLVLYVDDRHPHLAAVAIAFALLLSCFRSLQRAQPLGTRLTGMGLALLIVFASHMLNRLAHQARVNKGMAKPANRPSNS